ncbi:nitroreductase family protein [Niabella sp. W65]|nr:nitroreductase family protein [Niabella sp. W65]MCH7368751.1 nitroreductase family protein [Niabella sp. W65]ULT44325.1 nitroreductase family protein [Niabella sp. I65]
MSHIKQARTEYPVIDLIKKRWSPRAFADQAVSETDMHTILEAGSWAASSGNEQPWKYVYAMKGTPGFNTLWDCLMEGNQGWNRHAAVLMVAIARKKFARNGRDNVHAEHDLGMSNASMFLQGCPWVSIRTRWAGSFPIKLKQH